MSKGASNSKGSVSGSGGGGTYAQLINSIGGITNGIYLRNGMRDLSAARSEYAGGGNPNDIAMNLRYPIRIHIEPNGHGGRNVILNDGRHRMTAAREAGATMIKATVIEYGKRGGVRGKWTGVVKI